MYGDTNFKGPDSSDPSVYFLFCAQIMSKLYAHTAFALLGFDNSTEIFVGPALFSVSNYLNGELAYRGRGCNQRIFILRLNVEVYIHITDVLYKYIDSKTGRASFCS